MGAAICQKQFDGLSSKASTSGQSVPDHMEGLSDEKLIALYREGNQKAFDALIKRYERPIYNFAYRLSHNHDDAQEIVGEAYLRICLNLHLIQHAVTLRAWINRIVANIYINMRRRVKRTRAESLDALEEKAGDAVFRSVDALPESPEIHAEMSERKRIVDQAIRALPEYQRPIVSLFYQEGRSYEEIADFMHIPTGTVKSRLNRGRLNLKRQLAPFRTVLAN